MSVTTRYPLEAADPDCIDDATGAELLRRVPWRRLVVLGDSIAFGTREAVDGYRDEAFTNRLGEALIAAHPGAAFRNLAVHGARLEDIRDAQLEPALAFEPDLAIVIGGGNDAIARDYTAEGVRRGLLEVAEPLAAAGAQVVTIGLFDLARSGILPPEYADPLRERFDELDEITQDVARQVGALHIDTHHHPRAADPGIMASDNMHANTRGHAIAFAAVVRALAAHAA